MVKRYDVELNRYSDDFGEVYLDTEGEYVKYEDYKYDVIICRSLYSNACREIERLREEVEKLNGYIKVLQDCERLSKAELAKYNPHKNLHELLMNGGVPPGFTEEFGEND